MKLNISKEGASAIANGVKSLYDKGQTDYNLDPLVLVDNSSKPVGRIQDGDSVIFCCRRGEREIELTEAFTDPDFKYFPRPPLNDLNFVILTLYHEKFKDLPIAFAPSKIKGTLAELVSNAGLHQLHLAESEKFAHVTFFLNGGNNQPFTGEDDIGIPSPKGVSFDQVPELSLSKVAKQTIKGIKNNYDFIVVNFANGDVIGHTANNKAKVKCAELLDNALGQVLDASNAEGYVTLITADHGNLEEMINSDGSPHMSHTSNLVPFILLDPNKSSNVDIRNGKLGDIAPTILSAMGISTGSEMEGETLLPDYNWKKKRRVLLIILDGWGLGKKEPTNPIFTANTPVWDDIIMNYPTSKLHASGEYVGLKSGKPGNSEAGHLNIGGGRIIPQDDVRLDTALKDGTFFTNEVFLDTINAVKKKGSSLHLLGLLTEKSSHGSIDYPLALLEMAKEHELEKVFIHLIFDGRSTKTGSAPDLLENLELKLKEIGIGTVVSGFGRGLALDRDGDYKKIKLVFDNLVSGSGKPCQL